MSIFPPLQAELFRLQKAVRLFDNHQITVFAVSRLKTETKACVWSHAKVKYKTVGMMNEIWLIK